MTTNARAITPDDILSHDDYAKVRETRRREIIALKKDRRVEVGPFATFYFESQETMVQQIQEMLWIERGGVAQLEDELAAYNPLVPNGAELVATVMFEIDEEARRQRVLAELGGVEETIALRIGDVRIVARPELGDKVERTTAAGKTSSIHFLHFPFTAEEIDLFRDSEKQAVLEIGHENYAHMAVLPTRVRQALAGDFND